MKRIINHPLNATVWLLLWSFTATAQTVTSTLQLPLAGTVFVPLSGGAFDEIPSTGRIHVTSLYNNKWPPDPIRIEINLNQVEGFGGTTDTHYIATGSTHIALQTFPPDPIRFHFRLTPLAPPDPIKPKQGTFIPMDIELLFNFNTSTGKLIGAQIVSMEVPTGDIPLP